SGSASNGLLGPLLKLSGSNPTNSIRTDSGGSERHVEPHLDNLTRQRSFQVGSVLHCLRDKPDCVSYDLHAQGVEVVQSLVALAVLCPLREVFSVPFFSSFADNGPESA